MNKEVLGKYIYWIFLSFLIYVSFFYKLGYENINVDQFLWYERTENFFRALKEGNYSETYQQYHPGVTLMYLIGIGQLCYRLITGDYSIHSEISYQNYGLYNFFTKLPIVVFCLVIISLSTFLIYRATKSRLIAKSFFAILILESYYVGVLRNLHMDGILSVLIFSSVISFYLGCEEKSSKYFTLSGILSGLAFLTKSVSLFTPLFCVLISIYFLVRGDWKIKNMLRMAVIWLSTSALVSVLLFPALWVAPFETITKIINEGVLDTGVSGSFNHYLNNTMTEDPGKFFYVKVLAFRLTPVVQFLLLILLIRETFYFVRFKKLSPPRIYVFSAIFSAIYFLTFIFLKKKTDRYISPLFPFIVLLASYSVSLLMENYKNLRKRNFFSTVALFIFPIVSVAYYLWNIFTIEPYFFAYYNHMFGGIKYAQKEMYINQGGIGVFEISDYLDSLKFSDNPRFAATNERELQKVTKYSLEPPYPHLKDEYDIVIVPLQKDGFFKWKERIVKTFGIQGQVYWRVYSD